MAGSDHTTWVMQTVDAFEGRLLRYAADLVGPSLARDVVQDTFLRLCKQERAAVEPHLAGWLFTVCRRRGLELRRNGKRLAPIEAAEGREPSSPLPDVAVLRHELHGLVQGVLGELPERERELVRLKFDAELSYKEIAAVTGLSVTNVGFILHTAVRRLRDRLADAEQPKTATTRRPR